MSRGKVGRFGPLVVIFVACAAEAGTGELSEAACRIVQSQTPLPSMIEESSGVAASRGHPGVLWTHNDSGDESVIFAVRASGALVGRVEVQGAENDDWEDIAVGPCNGRDCLYIADTGDNAHNRDDLAIYRIPEPSPGNGTARAERFPIRYPNGHPDAEALFVLPSGEIFIVTRGRGEAQTVYRYPLPLRAGQQVELQQVVRLAGEPENELQQVTAASASPSGKWVAIREYKLLSVFRTADLVAGKNVPVDQFDLTAVGEAQGEGVALLDNGGVVLTSEGGFRGSPGTISVLQCELPAN